MASALDRAVTPLGRLLKNRRAGDEKSVRHAPELSVADGAEHELQLTSSAFEPGGVIPDIQSGAGRGKNLSPALAWSGLPNDTAQLLLIMEDVDVPIKHPAIHMSGLFDPSITHFDEGELTPNNLAVRFIPGLFGRTGYAGPRPLPGHGSHRYHFILYALDAPVPADLKLANLNALLPVVRGHVTARGLLTGVQTG